MEENHHYGISLILLSLDLLALALEKPAQWEAWQEQCRLSITPALAGDSRLSQSISIRPSRYSEDWPDAPPESEAITLSEIIADPRAFAEVHQKLSIDVFAQRGYDDPVYHIAEDDSLYFNYLRAVPDNSLEQAMAYFETLPDSYQLYGVSSLGESGEELDLHLFE